MYNTFLRTSNHRLCACVLTDDPEVAQLYKERNLFSKEADVVERREGESPRFGLIIINQSIIRECILILKRKPFL